MPSIRGLVMTAVVGAVMTAAAQPAADPVGFPAGYESFKQIRTTTVKQDPPNGAVFVNAPAASVETKAQLPYPFGSIVVMEWRRDGTGGRPGDVVRLDVMRKERGLFA